MATKKNKASNKKKTQKNPVETKSFAPEITAIVFVALSFFFIALMYTSGAGAVGNGIKTLFLGIFSVSAYLLPILLLCLGTNLIIEKRIFKHRTAFICSGIILIIISALYHYFNGGGVQDNFVATLSDLYISGTVHMSGGVVGGLINMGLTKIIGSIGTIIVYIAGLLICLTIIFKFSVTDFAKELAKTIKEKSAEKKRLRAEHKEEKALEKINSETEDFKPVIITNSDDDDE